MTSRELQIILKELSYLKERMGSLEYRMGLVETNLKDLNDKQVVLHNMLIELAENQAALQENISMFIVHMSRHDADIDTLKQKVGV